jgi:transposase-like protein
MPKPSSIPLSLVNAPEAAKLPQRRTFTAAYKLSIVEQANACTESGQLEALLRREGLYSSHLAKWRKQLRLRGSQGLSAARPGRKPTREASAVRIAELEAKTARLEKKLLIATELLALQKKVSQLLGIALPGDETP